MLARSLIVLLEAVTSPNESPNSEIRTCAIAIDQIVFQTADFRFYAVGFQADRFNVSKWKCTITYRRSCHVFHHHLSSNSNTDRRKHPYYVIHYSPIPNSKLLVCQRATTINRPRDSMGLLRFQPYRPPQGLADLAGAVTARLTGLTCSRSSV